MRQIASKYVLSRRGYYADFLIVPLLVALALLWTFQNFVVNPTVFVAAIISGAFVWSLAEYGIHRWVFHGVEPLKHQHGLHHAAPHDYIGASSLTTGGTFLTLMFGLPLVCGAAIGMGLFVGLLAGYYAYITIHDHFHHALAIRARWMHT